MSAAGGPRAGAQAASTDATPEAERARMLGGLADAPLPAFVSRGPEHRIVLVNECFRALTAARDALGRTAHELFRVPAGQSLLDALDGAWRDGEPRECNAVRLAFDGEHEPTDPRYFDLSVRPLRDPDGHVEALRCIVVEVTETVRARRRIEALEAELAARESRARAERERLEAVARSSEQQFHTLADTIAVLAWYAEPDGSVPWHNRRWLEYVFGSTEQHRELAWEEVHHPDDLPRIAPLRQQSLRTGTTYDAQSRIRRHDGVYRWFLTRVEPYRDASGRVVRWFGTNVDIDDQKRAEEALRFLSEAGVVLAGSLDFATTVARVARLAVPALADWTCVHLREPASPTRLVAVAHANPAREALVRELFERYPAGDDAARGYAAAIRAGTSELRECVTREDRAREARDARHRELLDEIAARSTMCVPLAVAGRTFGAMTFGAAESGRRYDADDLRLAEELGRRVAVALDNARLYEEAQRERARAEEASRAKDEFLAVLSHELRTPMTAILGWSRMLATGAVPADKVTRALEAIDRNSHVQAQLIDDLLDFSRIVSGKLRLELLPMRLGSVVDAALETVRPTADARGVRLRAPAPCAEDSVLGDAARLQQAVWNLLTNAVKFTPAGGEVSVSLRREGDDVVVVVADTGLGIDPGFLPFVFDRFRQADSSITRAHGGLGLGLAIVKNLVDLHGGSIDARSGGVGTGATFTLRLPAATHRAPSPAAGHDTRPAGRGDVRGTLAGLRVLVIDDEQDARDVVAGVLEHAGAEVALAAGAAEAFERLRLGAPARPDVIVSDIGMPGEDGYALIRRVRALPREQGGRVRAVALTAFARTEDRMRALAAGFNSHVAKPVDPQELVVVVANLAERHAGD